ncbi:hypothetical protein BO99DRAFT_468776, partial [Aspergillus violaceofuscus CBS 115571]
LHAHTQSHTPPHIYYEVRAVGSAPAPPASHRSVGQGARRSDRLHHRRARPEPNHLPIRLRLHLTGAVDRMRPGSVSEGVRKFRHIPHPQHPPPITHGTRALLRLPAQLTARFPTTAAAAAAAGLDQLLLCGAAVRAADAIPGRGGGGRRLLPLLLRAVRPVRGAPPVVQPAVRAAGVVCSGAAGGGAGDQRAAVVLRTAGVCPRVAAGESGGDGGVHGAGFGGVGL